MSTPSSSNVQGRRPQARGLTLQTGSTQPIAIPGASRQQQHGAPYVGTPFETDKRFEYPFNQPAQPAQHNPFPVLVRPRSPTHPKVTVKQGEPPVPPTLVGKTQGGKR